MSRRVNINKADSKSTECHVCKKNGEAVHVYSDHNFRDTKGRIACCRFLKKLQGSQCNTCGAFGHFADKCRSFVKFMATMERKKEVNVHLEFVQEKPKAVANGFAALEEESSDEEFEKAYPNITVRRKPALKKPKCWADYSDSDEE